MILRWKVEKERERARERESNYSVVREAYGVMSRCATKFKKTRSRSLWRGQCELWFCYLCGDVLGMFYFNDTHTGSGSRALFKAVIWGKAWVREREPLTPTKQMRLSFLSTEIVHSSNRNVTDTFCELFGTHLLSLTRAVTGALPNFLRPLGVKSCTV